MRRYWIAGQASRAAGTAAIRPKSSIAYQPLQVRSKLSSRLVTQRPVLFEGLVQDDFESGRQTRVQARGRSGSLVQDRIEDHSWPSVPETAAARWPSRTARRRRKTDRSCASNVSPRTCSGDMYATVPSALPGLVRCGSSCVGPSHRAHRTRGFQADCFASPKSNTLAWPRSVTKILAGLISRCTIPRACAASSASAISEPNARSACTSTAPCGDVLLKSPAP